MNKCHCGEPATWLLMAYTVQKNDGTEVVLFHMGMERTATTWAACDTHVAEAGRELRRIQAEAARAGIFVNMRPEPTI